MNDAAYKFSVLQPAWAVLTGILTDRRLQLLELLVSRHPSPTMSFDEIRGRIHGLDETMKILEQLELEAKA